ncbi:MAG TPA: hypothetical protein VFN26_13815 [Candidatus Acidoferrum sp.]|nr:hypothetical protein [Candidatus Acidoferrum sp.]
MLKKVRFRVGRQPLAALICLYLFSAAPDAFAQQSSSDHASSRVASTRAVAKWPEGFHEDWRSLTLESSTLKPERPVLLEKTELPDGKNVREHIQVGWRPNDTFDLYVILPKGAKKSPVILYLYSNPEGIARFTNNDWYTGTAVEGYAAVGFVSALTAERVLNRPLDETFLGMLPQSLASSVHDVQLILDYLNSRGDLDMDRVGMFGAGSGGTIAILASAADARIKAVDVLNPWGDWPTWAARSKVIPDERDQRLKYTDPQFLAAVAPLDPVRWLPELKARSVRIENVRQESSVPVESQEKIEEAAPVWAQINQFGDYRVLISMMPGSGITSWLRQELQSNATAETVAEKSKRVHFYPAEGKPFEQAPAQP